MRSRCQRTVATRHSVSIEFSPDGQSLIVGYPDSTEGTSNTIWLLPVDGSPGRMIGEGTFAELDIQRQAP